MLLAVGSAALALTVIGSVIGVARAARATGEEAGDGTRVLAGDVSTVRVDAAIADLVVRLADVAEPTVEWDAGATGLRLRSELADGELDVRVRDRGWDPFGWWSGGYRGPATLTVLLPADTAGVDLDLAASAGSVRLDGDWGAVDVEAAVGEVRLAGSAVSLDLRTTAGSTVGYGLEIAELTVEATAGDVDLAFDRAPATVDAATTAGDLRIALPRGDYELRTESTLGEVASAIPSTPGAERSYRLASTVGDIEILQAG
ncbi:DUF4097 family beta strand repeat-containing protein [Arenivirga flava]|uniref:DUF4097 domain-containing protein n=1 Tax=Arenivirga flava TaxID=1930060 RepID=A0AA37UG65_9MICO|nr:DUF4097 family beta strand repeat-containing protein [Arenivirga flava]GMA28238.1 hypothetical protein GCM10025874_14910 [Arenivirga flava]